MSRSEPYHRDRRLQSVSFDWPNDFTVNANFRGKSDGRVWRGDHPVTRYVRVPKGAVEEAQKRHRRVHIGGSSYSIQT